MECDLLQKHCVPCEGGVPRLSPNEIATLQKLVPDWSVSKDNMKIERTFPFKNFVQAMEFANTITDVAEAERHHPDLHIGYGKVTVVLWTHAIGGLSENDFIVAAKIDRLAQ